MQREVARAYSFYLAMFLILVGGLWTILNLGSALRAPQDISGEWNVDWTTPPPHVTDADSSTMRIEQSGQFCRVRIDDRLHLSLKIVDGTALHHGSLRQPL